MAIRRADDAGDSGAAAFAAGTGDALRKRGSVAMLVASLVFLLLAVVAALLGLGDLAGPLSTSFQTAFFVFLACAAIAVAVDAARSSRFRRRGTA